MCFRIHRGQSVWELEARAMKPVVMEEHCRAIRRSQPRGCCEQVWALKDTTGSVLKMMGGNRGRNPARSRRQLRGGGCWSQGPGDGGRKHA